MPERAVADTAREPERVVRRQQLNPMLAAAQCVQRLLDPPEVAIRDLWNREKSFDPVAADRLAMDQPEAAVDAGRERDAAGCIQFLDLGRIAVGHVLIEAVALV